MLKDLRNYILMCKCLDFTPSFEGYNKFRKSMRSDLNYNIKKL